MTLRRARRRYEIIHKTANHDFLNALFTDEFCDNVAVRWYKDMDALEENILLLIPAMSTERIQHLLNHHLRIKAIRIDYSRAGYEDAHTHNETGVDAIKIRKVGIKVSKNPGYRCPCMFCTEDQGFILSKSYSYAKHKYKMRTPLIWIK